MAGVMIGVDPHKASHTAVAISGAEEHLGQLRVRACAVQAERLLKWAAGWPERTWAVEGVGGLGHLLAQQLLSAGERVLDVQPELGARVRLLATGNVNKNDPNDARSVAVAALRSPGVWQARPDDHAAVLAGRVALPADGYRACHGAAAAHPPRNGHPRRSRSGRSGRVPARERDRPDLRPGHRNHAGRRSRSDEDHHGKSKLATAKPSNGRRRENDRRSPGAGGSPRPGDNPACPETKGRGVLTCPRPTRNLRT